MLSLLCGPVKPFQEQGERSDPIFTKSRQAAGVRVGWKHLEPDVSPSHLHLPASTEPHPLPDPLPQPEIQDLGPSGAWDPDCGGAFPHPELQLYCWFFPLNEMIQVVIFSVTCFSLET